MFNQLEINWFKVLLALNTILFVIMFFLSQNIRYNSDYILIGALSTDYVFKGFPWLLITANFLHFNLYHFIFNIFSLFNIGRIVDEFYSKKTMLTVYILTGLAGSLLTVFISMLLNSPMVSIGASGSIFGLAGLLVGGTLKKQRYGFGLPFSFRDLLFPIGISLLIGFLPGLNVNNWAHLGGFGAGLLLGLLLKNEMGEFKTETYKKLENILYYSSLIILILSFFLLLFNAVQVIFLY